MSSISKDEKQKPHAVCIPYPAQGHINPMLKLAKLLHFKGFHITFVNTDYNQKRLLKSRIPQALLGTPNFNFNFDAIPDGLTPLDTATDTTQDIPSLCHSTTKTCLLPFLNLLHKLNANSLDSEQPPVTCIVADVGMFFTVQAAEEIGVPIALFWTVSGCGALAYMHLPSLFERGIIPLKDASDLTNGYLETSVDLIPSKKSMALKTFPSFIRTTNPKDIMLNYLLQLVEQAPKASIGMIFNTFQSLESQVLSFLSTKFTNIFTIGPLNLLTDEHDHLMDQSLKSVGVNLWKEDEECLQWLNLKQPNSVLFVNFGSITVMNPNQLLEFAWGLANSKMSFLWIIRPDLVDGESAVLPSEFLVQIEGQGLLGNWCPQEQVLKHPAIGCFLTHNGWNSTLESLSYGIPMICWPFFAEQNINCHYCCMEWGIGMEIINTNNITKRDEIEELVRELMEGEKGKEMKKKAMEWKLKANEAIQLGGSSFHNLEELVSQLTNNNNRN